MTIKDKILQLTEEINKEYCTKDISVDFISTKKPKMHCIFLMKNDDILMLKNVKNQKQVLSFLEIYKRILSLILD